MNPHEHMGKMRKPEIDARVDEIVQREGGSRIPDEITVRCCDLVFTGPAEIALGLSAAHRRKAHPHTVKKRRFVSPQEKQAQARESGNLASRKEES